MPTEQERAIQEALKDLRLGEQISDSHESWGAAMVLGAVDRLRKLGLKKESKSKKRKRKRISD